MKAILLVDDDHVSGILHRRFLQLTGVVKDIRIVLSAKQALQMFHENGKDSSFFPDIILLDLSMPEMNGFEFLEAFRKLNSPCLKNIKIVVLSASISEDDIVRIKHLGVFSYLLKPASIGDLKRILN